MRAGKQPPRRNEKTMTADLIDYCLDVQTRIRAIAAKDPAKAQRLTTRANYRTRASGYSVGAYRKPVVYLTYSEPDSGTTHNVACCDSEEEARFILSARLGALIG